MTVLVEGIMSYVHLVIAKDDNVYFVSVHYRTAMKLLDKGVDSILPLLKPRFLDAGYLMVDLNRQVIVNGQCAFPVCRIVKKLCVIEA
jgi:hypothetical protein